MARMKVDKAKRRAAGHILLGLFHLLESGVAHPLRTMTDTRLNISTGMGLTPKEIELIHEKTQEIHELGDLMRRLGWRLLKEDRSDG